MMKKSGGSSIFSAYQTLPGPPFPHDAPVLVLHDRDHGWIVEAVTQDEFGEYEIKGENERSDRLGAIEEGLRIAGERGVRVLYYHRWRTAAELHDSEMEWGDLEV